MIKKIILSMIVLSALLQADNIFSKLPYGIEIGEKVPDKILNMNIKSVHWYDDRYGYDLPGKFNFLYGSKTHRVCCLVFSGDSKQTLPKKLRNSGLWLCSKKYPGTPYEDVLQIIKKNDISDLQSNKVTGKISFKVDNNKQYSFHFNSTLRGTCKKGGLHKMKITEIKEDEY